MTRDFAIVAELSMRSLHQREGLMASDMLAMHIVDSGVRSQLLVLAVWA